MKPTWTKVYSGPGYPIDPAKESERNAVKMFDFIPCHPNDVMVKFLQAITDGLIQPEKAILIGVDTAVQGADISVLSPIDPEYSCVMVPPEPAELPKCNCPACVMENLFGASYVHETFKHQHRYAMIMTEDFQSRLMAIEVKERGI